MDFIDVHIEYSMLNLNQFLYIKRFYLLFIVKVFQKFHTIIADDQHASFLNGPPRAPPARPKAQGEHGHPAEAQGSWPRGPWEAAARWRYSLFFYDFL